MALVAELWQYVWEIVWDLNHMKDWWQWCALVLISGCELEAGIGTDVGGGTTLVYLIPINHTYKVTRCTQTALHATFPERLPWESVPKQLTVRQVHEHGGTPRETGQDLTEQTSQPTNRPSNPLPTKALTGDWPMHTLLWSQSTSQHSPSDPQLLSFHLFHFYQNWIQFPNPLTEPKSFQIPYQIYLSVTS